MNRPQEMISDRRVNHRCRVCDSPELVELGEYQAYLDYKTEVLLCRKCSCRQTVRDGAVYDQLHRQSDSSYGWHTDLANKVYYAFSKGQIDTIEQALAQTPKYRFIMDTLRNLAPNSKVLEIGCSQGYLLAWFILRGFDAKGVDVSDSAVRAANRYFGPHFSTPQDFGDSHTNQFDAIFHVGTVGCVDSPTQWIETLLDWVKPGGLVLFNAPNVDACRYTGELWLESTKPPDLVTLFSPELWEPRFKHLADVQVLLRLADPKEAAWLRWRRIKRKLGLQFRPRAYLARVARRGVTSRIASHVEAFAIRALSRFTIIERVARISKIPSEYGTFVILRKKLSPV